MAKWAEAGPAQGIGQGVPVQVRGRRRVVDVCARCRVLVHVQRHAAAGEGRRPVGVARHPFLRPGPLPVPLGVDRPHPHLVDRLRRQPRDAGTGRRAGVGRVGPAAPDRGDGAGGAGPQPLLHVVAVQRRLARHHRRRPGHRQPVGRGTHRQIGGRVRRLGHVGDVDRQGDGVVPVRVGLARAVLAVPHLDHQGVAVPGRLEVRRRLEGQDPGAGHGERSVVVGDRGIAEGRRRVQPVGEIVPIRVGHVRRGHRRLVLRRVDRRGLPGVEARRLVQVVDLYGHRDGVRQRPVAGGDHHRVAGLLLVVQRPLGLQLAAAGHDGEVGRAGPAQRVGQGVPVQVRGRRRVVDVCARCRVLVHVQRHAAAGEGRRPVGVARRPAGGRPAALPLVVDRPHPDLVDRLRRQPRDAGTGRRAGVGRVGPAAPDRGDGAGGAGPQPLLHVVAVQRRLARHHRRRPGHRQPVGRGTHRQIGGRVRRLGHVGDVDRQGDGVVPDRVGLARAVLAVPYLDDQGVGVPGRLEVRGRVEGEDAGAGHGERSVVVGDRGIAEGRRRVQPVGEIVPIRVGHVRRGHRRLVLRRVDRRGLPVVEAGRFVQVRHVDGEDDGVVPVRVAVAVHVLAVPHLDHQGVGVLGGLEVGGRLEGQDPAAGHGEQRVVVGGRSGYHRGGVQPVGEIVPVQVGDVRRGHRRLVLRCVHRRGQPVVEGRGPVGLLRHPFLRPGPLPVPLGVDRPHPHLVGGLRRQPGDAGAGRRAGVGRVGPRPPRPG